MSKRMQISYVDEEVSVQVELLEEEAPKTCKVVWDNLPIEGMAGNAKFCGDMILFPIPATIKLDEQENLEQRPLTGEIHYWWGRGGMYHGWNEDSAELGWAYDRHAVIATPFEGPTLANIFGRMVGDTTKFLEVSKRIASEGKKKVRVSRIG